MTLRLGLYTHIAVVIIIIHSVNSNRGSSSVGFGFEDVYAGLWFYALCIYIYIPSVRLPEHDT